MATSSSGLPNCDISFERMSTSFQNISIQNYDSPEKWIVIWLEPAPHEHQTMNESGIEPYCDIIGDVKIFNCRNTCVDFLTDLIEEKVCLILSQHVAKTLVPLIHDFAPLKLIYTLHDPEEDDIVRKRQWAKFKGSFSTVYEILRHFKQNIRRSQYDLTSISIVSSSNAGDPNELDSLFMYSQLLKDILLQMQYNKNSKSDFVDYLRGQYANNSINLRSVNTFDQTYSDSDRSPIWWYTKEVFIYGPLNRALRTQQTDTILRMGFFIHDLHREIERLHKAQQPHQHMYVYRGQALMKNDFEKLQKNQGGLISFNNFLSTSTDEEVSRFLAESSASQENSVGILFRIDIDPSISTVPFASLDEFTNHSTEKEVLFTMHTICRIGTVQNIGEGVWQVNLTLTADNDEQLKRITESIREQIRNGSANRSLGYLLYRMGEYETAEKIFKKTLASTAEDDAKSRLYLYEILGGITHAKGAYPTALSYFQQILEMCPLPADCNNFDLSAVYMNMGSIHHSMGDFSTAADFHELVISMREKSFTHSARDLAAMYNNAALTYASKGSYTEALRYFEKSLDYLQRTLPPLHPDLSIIYSNIGMINSLIGERETALRYHEKTLEIQRKSLPPDHLSIATTLNNIASGYQWIGQYETAIKHFKTSLSMVEGTSFCEHPDFAVVHNNVGQLYKACSEYDKALPHFLKAIEVQKAMRLPNDSKLAVFYINIALLYRLMGDLLTPIEYLEKADQLQRSLADNHPERARTYNGFGMIYQAKKEYWMALDYYQKAVKIQEEVLPSTHPDLACIYNNLADVELHLGREDAALEYIEKTLHILQTHLQSNHPDIGRTYLNKATIYMRMQRYDEARECFDKTHEIYKALPQKQHNIGAFYANISKLNCAMGNFPKALKHLRKARDIFQEVLPPDHPDLLSVQETINRFDAQMPSFGSMSWNS